MDYADKAFVIKYIAPFDPVVLIVDGNLNILDTGETIAAEKCSSFFKGSRTI